MTCIKFLIKFNTEYVEMVELKNLLENALITNKESRGTHSHDDYKIRDDKNGLCNTIARLKEIQDQLH